jgi:glycine oxidase
MSPDVAIVGAGVIGCAIAYELACARAGHIVVIDRGQPGAEASNASAGLLPVASSRAPRGVLFELRRAGASLFPQLAATLLDDSGIDVEYRTQGLLELAFSEAEAGAITGLAARRREQGFEVRGLDPAAVAEIEPAVNPAIRSAVLFPSDCAVNSERLVAALQLAGERRGVEFRLGAPLTGVESAGTRVVAITAGGERLMPRWLVVAAGVWSREVGALLRSKVPVRPDRGEMVALRPRVTLSHTVVWKDGYLVPRNDGEVLVGSTSARGVSDKTVTAKSLALLLRRAIRMVPALEEATLVRAWAGLRPCSLLRRPIIGPARGYENVILATGHHRSGILLAPITAQLVRELITCGATSISLQPFCHKAR